VIQKLEPIPSLASIREIIFTSPSTVEGFFDIFKGEPLENKKLNCIGPVTENALAKILSYSNRSK
jgi:uroporphyrinogen-III synthase